MKKDKLDEELTTKDIVRSLDALTAAINNLSQVILNRTSKDVPMQTFPSAED